MKNLQIDGSTGLVLEGGGMRGVFTCGVLDYFMDHDIRFPYAIGVSAGACNGLSYASRQRGRAKYSNIDLYGELLYPKEPARLLPAGQGEGRDRTGPETLRGGRTLLVNL